MQADKETSSSESVPTTHLPHDGAPENTTPSTPPATPPKLGGPSTGNSRPLHEAIGLLSELPDLLERASGSNTTYQALVGAMVVLWAARLWGGLIFPALRSSRARACLVIASSVLLACEPLASGEHVSVLSVACAMLPAIIEALQSAQR